MPWHSQADNDDLSFAVRVMRADFQAQPPDKQRETMERVQQLVTAQPQSYLARHWTDFYRLRGEE